MNNSKTGARALSNGLLSADASSASVVHSSITALRSSCRLTCQMRHSLEHAMWAAPLPFYQWIIYANITATVFCVVSVSAIYSDKANGFSTTQFSTFCSDVAPLSSFKRPFQAPQLSHFVPFLSAVALTCHFWSILRHDRLCVLQSYNCRWYNLVCFSRMMCPPGAAICFIFAVHVFQIMQ